MFVAKWAHSCFLSFLKTQSNIVLFICFWSCIFIVEYVILCVCVYVPISLMIGKGAQFN